MKKSHDKPASPKVRDVEFVKLLNRRLQVLRSGRVKGIPAEELMARLTAKYG